VKLHIESIENRVEELEKINDKLEKAAKRIKIINRQGRIQGNLKQIKDLEKNCKAKEDLIRK